MSDASAQEKNSGHDVHSDDDRKKQSSESTGVTAERPHNKTEQNSALEKSPQEERREILKAWKRVAGAWLLFFIAWGPALAYGSFETYYRTQVLPDYSASQLAWIGALATLLLVCAGAFAGPLFDRGYLRAVLVCGCLLLVFSLEMLSLCTEYYQIILAQGVGYGLGSGLIYVPALAFVTASFPPKTRAYAVGVLTTGAGFAGVVYPIMFIRLIPEIGFGWTMRLWGFLSLSLAVIALMLVWDAPTKTTRPRSLVDWSAFTEYPFMALCSIGFCQFLGYWIPLFYVPAFAESTLRVSNSESIYFICYISAGSIFGRLLPTPLIAMFGPIPVMFGATGLTAVILFCWIAVKSYAGFVVWCLAIGFTSGLFVSVNPVVASLPMISPPEVLGTRFGIIWFAAALGALVGTPIAGALANPSAGDFLKAQVFTACIMTGATLLICILCYASRHFRRRGETD